MKKGETKKVKKEVKVTGNSPAYKSVPELMKAAKSLRQEITMHRLKVRAGKEPNSRKGFNDRKELARILTALNSKKLSKQPQSEV